MHTEGAVVSLFYSGCYDGSFALLQNENLTHKAVLDFDILLVGVACWPSVRRCECGPICLRARSLACCFFFFKLLRIQSPRLTVFSQRRHTQLRPPCPAASCWGTRWCSDTVAMIMMMIVLPWLLLTENTSCPVSLSAKLSIYFPRQKDRRAAGKDFGSQVLQDNNNKKTFFFSPVATLPCVRWAAWKTNPTDGDDQRHCYWRHLLMQASCFTLILMHHVDSSTKRAAPSSDGELGCNGATWATQNHWTMLRFNLPTQRWQEQECNSVRYADLADLWFSFSFFLPVGLIYFLKVPLLCKITLPVCSVGLLIVRGCSVGVGL